jgi:hypothetical protein
MEAQSFGLCLVQVHWLALTGVGDTRSRLLLCDSFRISGGGSGAMRVLCIEHLFLFGLLVIQSVDVNNGSPPLTVSVGEASACVDLVNDGRLDLFMEIFDEKVIMISLISSSLDQLVKLLEVFFRCFCPLMK